MFVQDDRLVVDYNAFGDHTVLESGTEVPAGDATVSMRLERTSRTAGTLHEVEIQLAPRTRRDDVDTARAEMARQRGPRPERPVSAANKSGSDRGRPVRTG